MSIALAAYTALIPVGKETASALVIDVEGGEDVLAGRVAVAVGECAQLLQALGHRPCKAVLTRHIREQDYVARRLLLVAAVCAAQLLHLFLQQTELVTAGGVTRELCYNSCGKYDNIRCHTLDQSHRLHGSTAAAIKQPSRGS